MGDATCSESGCTRRAFARGFCQPHYGKRHRAGTLPPQQLTLPFDRHTLYNINRETQTADCTVCGPGTRIRVRDRTRGGQVDCRAHGRPRGPGSRQGERLRYKYGISLADYESMYKAQGGCCAICRAPHAVLCVDHCHSTRRVRGLLCSPCNTGIGHLRDSPDLLRKAIAYLGE